MILATATAASAVTAEGSGAPSGSGSGAAGGQTRAAWRVVGSDSDAERTYGRGRLRFRGDVCGDLGAFRAELPLPEI